MKLRVDLTVNAVLVTGKSVGVSRVLYNNTSFTFICIYCTLCMCLYSYCIKLYITIVYCNLHCIYCTIISKMLLHAWTRICCITSSSALGVTVLGKPCYWALILPIARHVFTKLTHLKVYGAYSWNTYKLYSLKSQSKKVSQSCDCQ